MVENSCSYFSAKGLCVLLKCLATFDRLLASFSPQIRHISRPLAFEVNANESAQASLNVLFS